MTPRQVAGAACPVLDLSLGPIDLTLLGLNVQTSPICLTITAYQNGGLLGALLCDIANLLNGGLSLNQILAGLGTFAVDRASRADRPLALSIVNSGFALGMGTGAIAMGALLAATSFAATFAVAGLVPLTATGAFLARYLTHRPPRIS